MKKILFTFLFLLALAPSIVDAQEAPAPRRMPRTPVSREATSEPSVAMPPSHDIQGTATIIDSEKLKVGNFDIRLFGVVPPQLSASFGPQARASLDSLANGQTVTCQIRDRDRDGRLLATCRTANGNDMALELLRHGFAVAARGSLAGTELASSYAAAEQIAQAQHLGLWSISTIAVPVITKQEAAAKVENLAPASAASEEAKKETAQHLQKSSETETQDHAKITATLLAQQNQAQMDDNAWTEGENVNFFERYQILLAGLLMLLTATGIMTALYLQKSRDRREETRAVAAALRGELMAARSVCSGRAKTITSDSEDSAALWPRLRSILYQAYVGRLGLLGAELARQVASIYGQASDYGALYSSGANQEISKKTALENLIKHIDEVLPKLSEIERQGYLSNPSSLPRNTRALLPPPTQTTEPPASKELVAQKAAKENSVARSTYNAASTLIDAARNFIQTHAPIPPQTPPPQPPQSEAILDDHDVSEYAAMIEADMARYYQYGENIEPLDISPQQKRG